MIESQESGPRPDPSSTPPTLKIPDQVPPRLVHHAAHCKGDGHVAPNEIIVQVLVVVGWNAADEVQTTEERWACLKCGTTWTISGHYIDVRPRTELNG